MSDAEMGPLTKKRSSFGFQIVGAVGTDMVESLDF